MRWPSITLLSAVLSASSVLANPIAANDAQVALVAPEGPIKATGDKWSYTDCGSPDLPIQVISIEVYPDPPKPGQDLTVKVKANVLERIEDGAYADVTVKVGLVKLLSKTFDVCEEARNANATVQCPVEPGPYEIEQTVALPKEVPRAKFHVFVEGYTVEDDDMLCLQLSVDFSPNFPRPRKFW
ncbi:vacuole protein [Coprinopsis marcescibilis]|uniref:Phosphatidylglycerol/phosphatidylinositol transfer protein n=1 Tax=Coprinopsis marcescibilis TaxID=230819 RepID=A0A5C3LBS3_COPMA|nr:vacuole protein [Coprinopsis marcescibilis]